MLWMLCRPAAGTCPAARSWCDETGFEAVSVWLCVPRCRGSARCLSDVIPVRRWVRPSTCVQVSEGFVGFQRVPLGFGGFVGCGSQRTSGHAHRSPPPFTATSLGFWCAITTAGKETGPASKAGALCGLKNDGFPSEGRDGACHNRAAVAEADRQPVGCVRHTPNPWSALGSCPPPCLGNWPARILPGVCTLPGCRCAVPLPSGADAGPVPRAVRGDSHPPVP